MKPHAQNQSFSANKVGQVDKHFPHLTVGQTLEFAAAVRTPQKRIQGLARDEWIKYMTKVMMAVFGLSHTYNTKVGDDFVRGVSGGERKRMRIIPEAIQRVNRYQVSVLRRWLWLDRP